MALDLFFGEAGGDAEEEIRSCSQNLQKLGLNDSDASQLARLLYTLQKCADPDPSLNHQAFVESAIALVKEKGATPTVLLILQDLYRGSGIATWSKADE